MFITLKFTSKNWPRTQRIFDETLMTFHAFSFWQKDGIKWTTSNGKEPCHSVRLTLSKLHNNKDQDNFSKHSRIVNGSVMIDEQVFFILFSSCFRIWNSWTPANSSCSGRYSWAAGTLRGRRSPRDCSRSVCFSAKVQVSNWFSRLCNTKITLPIFTQYAFRMAQ